MFDNLQNRRSTIAASRLSAENWHYILPKRAYRLRIVGEPPSHFRLALTAKFSAVDPLLNQLELTVEVTDGSAD